MPLKKNHLQFIEYLPLLVVFLLSLQPLHGGDLLWHLRLGTEALQTGEFPTIDHFSHTFFGAPTAIHAPLFQLMVAEIYQLGGWPLLVLLKALLITLIYFCLWLCWRTSEKIPTKRSPWIAWILAATILLATPQFDLHPQLFFFLLTASLLLAFNRSRTPKNIQDLWPYLFATVISVLWAWLHPSFIFGIVLLLWFAWMSRNYCWLIVASATALMIFLIEPSFYQNVFTHASSDIMLENVGYWKPLWTIHDTTLQSLWIMMHIFIWMMIAGFFSWQKKSHWQRIGLLALVAVISYMSMRSIRFFPLTLMIFPRLFLSSTMQFLKKHLRFINRITITYLVICLLIFLSSPLYAPGISLDKSAQPIAALKFIRLNNVQGEMFNSYNFGSYLIFDFDGNHRVFIDPRSSQLYPDDFYRNFLDAYKKPEIFEELTKRYQIGYTLIKTHSPLTGTLLKYLDQAPQWKKVYQDEIATIHIRSLIR